ncbi:ABC transporter ATP-binding protein [Streptomyces hiroshimensis]|uniref:ABC transporter ATP-binding protein n=1 Tax=Streptomyces hiroshimensis TaxID=66424 RepID=A0ABQ2Y683_9ACTN|nr:ABC transporter ATP-binding protein [Streptomyces hiroshimensis]GGX69179.1 ABC transporter ATP-binding protein [Streptomyces hiroshimensis]
MNVRAANVRAMNGGIRNGGIRFDGVTVAYDATVVLDDFDLTVEPGEVMALLGPSGSGKTTALRAVAGFVRPRTGRVLIGGQDVTALPPHRRGIGMVVQQYALFPHMRVEANVAFGLKARKVPRGEIAGRVAEALEMTGMDGFAERYPRELSGGQQQRVAIARALAVRPGVLLLDEPLSALDARLRAGMLTELARLHRELPGLSMLYVTHDQSEALTLADRIAVMDRARLRDCGTPQSLYRAPGSAFTASFVGSANLLAARWCGEDAVELDGGVRIRVRGSGGGEGEATLCIRPHLIGLGEPPGPSGPPSPDVPDMNVLHGAVTGLQWRGASHRVTVSLPPSGAELTAEVRELSSPPALGEKVSVHFAAADAVVLPPGGTP